VLVIEHHLDVVRAADYLIDLGPEGGAGGGRLVAAGTPEAVAQVPTSHTGAALRMRLAPTPNPADPVAKRDRRAASEQDVLTLPTVPR
jgi:excinuclease ABC subunit A